MGKTELVLVKYCGITNSVHSRYTALIGAAVWGGPPGPQPTPGRLFRVLVLP